MTAALMAKAALKVAVKDTVELTITGWARIPSNGEAATGKEEMEQKTRDWGPCHLH